LEKWFKHLNNLAPDDGFVNKQKYPTAADCVAVVLYKAFAPWKPFYKLAEFDINADAYSKLKKLADRAAEAPGLKEYIARSVSLTLNPFAKKPDPAKDLTDGVVTLCPYFKLKDAAKFKEIWQEDYKKFAHKEDCVHYAFCFTEDNTRAHCREAYPNAEKVLQHLGDVDVPLKAVLDGPADLERLEVHGPQAEIDKLREALTPLGCLFYVTEWGSRPKKAAMENDTVMHLYPYFKLKKPAEFKSIWFEAYPDTVANMTAEKSHQYAFSFEPTQGDGVASCRESYGDAEAILLHLKNVDTPLKAVLDGPAELLRLEVHGPAAENAKLKDALGPLGCEFFNAEWGFRNEVK